MKTMVALSLLFLTLAVPLSATLQCSNLGISYSSRGVTCGSCNQWAYGTVTKSGSDYGWLCLATCGVHSFNVCDPTITLWVGTSSNESCIEVSSGTGSVNWCFESSREDWQQGSWAEIYINVPCFNCGSKNVKPQWATTCDSCTDCQ